MTRASDVSGSYVASLRSKGYGWAVIAKMTGAAEGDLRPLFGEAVKVEGVDAGRPAIARPAEPSVYLAKFPAPARPAKPSVYVPKFPLEVPFRPADDDVRPVAKAKRPKPRVTKRAKRGSTAEDRLRALLTPDAVAARDWRLERGYCPVRVGIWAAVLGVTAPQAAMLEVLFVLAGDIVPMSVLFERSRAGCNIGREVRSISALMQNQMCRLRKALAKWDADAAPVTVKAVGWQLPVPVAKKLADVASPIIARAGEIDRLRREGVAA